MIEMRKMYINNTTTKQNSALLEDKTCQLLTGEQHTHFQKSTVLYSLEQTDDVFDVSKTTEFSCYASMENIEIDAPDRFQ